MGQDYPWDSEEQHRKWTAQLICSSFFVFDETASGTVRSNIGNIIENKAKAISAELLV